MSASVVFFRELRAGVKPVLLWSVVMVLALASGMTKYAALSSVTEAGMSVTELLQGMPASLRGLLGFGNFDVGTLVGYLGILFIYIELVLAVQATLLGANIIAKEERDKTAEYLFGKPVRRSHVVAAKLLAALVQVTVLFAVTLGITLAVVPAYNTGPDLTPEILSLFGSLALVQLVFLTLGAALASVLRNPGHAGGWASAVLVVGYLIARLTGTIGELEVLNILSPFAWFNLDDLVAGKGLETVPVVASLGLAVLLVGVSLGAFPRRDLRI